MRILEMRAIPGPNIYSHSPVFTVKIDLEQCADITTAGLPGFAERLAEALPGLIDHHCSRGRPGGFMERLREGTYLGHVFEHVALELQTAAGESVSYGTTRSADSAGVYWVAFSYNHPRVAGEAAEAALELVDTISRGRPYDVRERLKGLSELAMQFRPGPSTRAVLDAAAARNLPVIPLDDGLLYQVGYGRKSRRIQAAETSLTSNIAADIATDKVLTKKLLLSAGLPVAEGTAALEPEEACRAARRLGYPVVVKPADGCKGKGVTLFVENDQEVREAFTQARVFSTRIMIEKQIPGLDYRVIVVDGKVAAAAERRPPVVVGDGLRSIEALVEELNRDPRRGDDHEMPLTKVTMDSVALHTLEKQGLTPATVLDEGRTAYLRWQANLSTGGSSRDVTDEVHPDIKAVCARAAHIVGLDIAGIDLIAHDIARPDGGGFAVIEVNAAPGLRMHIHPAEGNPRPVGNAIIDYLFDGNDGRIPIIAVTGTNGKTTTVRMLASMYQEAGLRTGYSTTDGVYIGDRKILDGDLAGPAGAGVLLQDPTIDAVVLEAARGGLIRKGLAYDYARVGVITNISEDHLGQDGAHSLEDLAYAKSLVVECVDPNGYAVLNADDPLVAGLQRRSPGRAAFFSTSCSNMLVHHAVSCGELCAYVTRQSLVVQQGTVVLLKLALSRIPATMGGKATHNIENALAAALAACAAGLPIQPIKSALMQFRCDMVHNPGRFNLYNYGRLKVLIDYGHNPAGILRVLEAVRFIPHRVLIGVIAAPGDRANETIRRVGCVAGEGFDRLIIKEDSDKRGRQPGEVARLLCEGAMSSRSRNGIDIVLDEAEAVRFAVRHAPARALVVVFYEKLHAVIHAVQQELGPLPVVRPRNQSSSPGEAARTPPVEDLITQ